jgi:predicted membrane protein
MINFIAVIATQTLRRASHTELWRDKLFAREIERKKNEKQHKLMELSWNIACCFVPSIIFFFLIDSGISPSFVVLFFRVLYFSTRKSHLKVNINRKLIVFFRVKFSMNFPNFGSFFHSQISFLVFLASRISSEYRKKAITTNEALMKSQFDIITDIQAPFDTRTNSNL